MTKFKAFKISEQPPNKKGGIGIKTLLLVIILGLIIGFWGPIKIFKKKVVVRK